MFYFENKSDNQLSICNLIDYNTDCYDIFNSEFLIKLKDLPEIGRYEIKTEDSRPDLLSFNIYGDLSYWRYILWYNDINFSTDVKKGLIIKLFSPSDLSALIYNLKQMKKFNKVLK